MPKKPKSKSLWGKVTPLSKKGKKGSIFNQKAKL